MNGNGSGSNGTTDPLDAIRAEVMLRGYDARWGDASEYDVLAVEAEFRAPLVNPETGATSRTWSLAGKLDGVIRERGGAGRVLILEHKTSSEDVSPGSDYIKRLRMDGQISIYYEGANALLGPDIDGCLYDVLCKPRLRPLAATPEASRKYTKDGRLYAAQRDRDETPEEFRARLVEAVAADPNGYYARAEVVRLAAEMDESRFDVWQTAKQLREAELAGRFPRNPDACVHYGRTCEFFGVCTGEASLADPSLFRRADVAHEELAAADGSRVLTASRLACARRCQRAHKHRYLDGYRPVREADTLHLGHLVHAGLAAWWSAAPGERLEAAMKAITNTNGGTTR